MTSPKIMAEKMRPLELVDFMGSQFGSVLSLKARRSQFLTQQPVTMLYTHHSPVQTPVVASYLELVQRAGLPGPNGKEDRIGIERILSTFEIPGIPPSMTSTYTLKIPQMPLLPPSIQLGPIDISYFVRVVATYPGGGHEMLGPVELTVLPDVQRVEIPPGFDDAVELLEGSPELMNGPIVRPRILELIQWVPLELRQPQPPPPHIHHTNASILTRASVPVSMISSIGPQPPFRTPSFPSPGAMPPGPMTTDDMLRRANIEREAQEQACRISLAHAELERVKKETQREREAALVRKRADEERIRAEAQAEMERQLLIERERTLELRKQVERMKSGAQLGKVDPSGSSRSSVHSVPPPLPETARPASMLPQTMVTSPTQRMSTSLGNEAPVVRSLERHATMEKPMDEKPSPALSEHAYPQPKPLSNAGPPSENGSTSYNTPPSSTSVPARKLTWFSRSQASATSRHQSVTQQASTSETEQLVESICEQATSDYRAAVKRNYKALMGAKDRDLHKVRIMTDVSALMSGILGEGTEAQSALNALEGEFQSIDKDIVQSFEVDKKNAILRQIKNLNPSLLAAIAAGVVTDEREIHEQCAIALKPLRQDLQDSIFYIGMRDSERRELEALANRIWNEGMRCFELEVRDPLIREIRSLKEAPRGGSNSGTPSNGPVSAAQVVGGLGFSKGGGSGGSTTGSVTPASTTSSKPKLLGFFSKAQADPNAMCLRDGCGVRKTGHGSTKMFCSQKCETLVMKEQQTSFK
ncbi:hypothetical protein BC830DRAFT_874479 [Chytriomyces sp. MP71]|nr:hypothetical protein BC830DRAFT_874479 [Chytriomyces sp. MP71]